MALLTTYDETNRVVDSDLQVSYTKRSVFGDWRHTVGAGQDIYTVAWEYTRSARKSYRYVGMDHDTALSCQTAMISKYTRTQYNSIWDLNDDGKFAPDITRPTSILMADISVQHDSGCMWSVVVSVNESDVRMSLDSVNPDTLFTLEDARDYDTAVSNS